MKRIHTRITALAAALILALGLTACSNPAAGPAPAPAAPTPTPDPGPVGSYEMTKMGVNGVLMDMDDVIKLAGDDVDIPYITMELMDDDTFSMTMELAGDTDSVEGTWELDGDTLKLKGDGETIKGEVDGDEVTLDIDDDVTIVLEKE